MNCPSKVMNISCPVCQRKLTADHDQFCIFHQIAFRNIQERYSQWANAYGSLDMKEYLLRVAENENSGLWVTEVAKYLLNKGLKTGSEGGTAQELTV